MMYHVSAPFLAKMGEHGDNTPPNWGKSLNHKIADQPRTSCWQDVEIIRVHFLLLTPFHLKESVIHKDSVIAWVNSNLPGCSIE